jgi:hypothetical protein
MWQAFQQALSLWLHEGLHTFMTFGKKKRKKEEFFCSGFAVRMQV